MHRSGTSALAGVLSILGCDKPDTLMAPNNNNEKGYFESGKLYGLHTQLFASAATRWDDWLPMPTGWFDGPRANEFHNQAVEIMTGEFGKSQLFMIKDPRICRLVPFWESVLATIGATPAYVLTHRNPLEVAASLQLRDGISTGHGLLIWLRHVLEAENDTRGRNRSFTSFSQLIANWAGVADKIQTDLGTRLPRFSLGAASEVDSFLEGSLMHHRVAPEKVLHNPMLSSWVRDTYEIIERWAAKGEDPNDHDRLNLIRAAFDESAPAFASTIESGVAEARLLSGSLAVLSTELEAVRDEKAAMTARIDELRVGVSRREEKIVKGKGELDDAKARIAELHEAAKAAETQRSARAIEIDELQSGLAQERKELAQRSHEASEALKALEILRAEAEEREQSYAARLKEFERTHEELLQSKGVQASEIGTLQRRLAQEQSALAQRSHEASETHKALEKHRAEAAEREQSHAVQLKELKRTHDQLIESHDMQASEVCELQGRLAQERSALAQRSLEASETHKDLELLRTESKEREQSYVSQLAELKRTHDQLVEAFRGQVMEVGALESQLAQALSALAQGRHDASETGKALEELRAESAEREQYLAVQMEERRHEAAEIVRLRESVAASANRLLDRESRFREQDATKAAQLHSLEDRLQGFGREMAEVTRLLANKESEIEQERKTAAEALAQQRESGLAALEHERIARASIEARAVELDNLLKERQQQFSEAIVQERQSALEMLESERSVRALIEAKAAELDNLLKERQQQFSQAIVQERQSALEMLDSERGVRAFIEAKAAELDNLLQERQQQFSEAIVQERQSALEMLESERNARASIEAKTVELDSLLQERQRELSEVSNRFAMSEQALSALRGQSQLDMAAVRAQIEEREERIQLVERQFRDKISALRASPSWRMTRPVRAIGSWLRKKLS